MPYDVSPRNVRARWRRIVAAARLCLVMWLTGAGSALAAPDPPGIVRGPYLQSLTQTSVVIRWRTDIPASSLVAYGTNSEDLLAIRYYPNLVTNHSVLVPNLDPGTRYYYGVGYDLDLLASGQDYYFHTAPDRPEPVRIWAIGDSGTAAFAVGKVREVRDAYLQFTGDQRTDVWLMLGDNAYNEGEDSEYQIAVFETFPNILRHTPLWSTIGNHETYAPLPDESLAYFHIFQPPFLGEAGGVASGTLLYYSFNYANIHFVCLDSEISYNGKDGPMIAWLEQDLAANTNEWVIAFWHSPPYSKGSHNSDNPNDSNGHLFQMRTNVVPVLEAHGTDLVLCGHSHNYERSFLMTGHYGTSDTLEPHMILDAGSGRTNDTGAYFKPTQDVDANSGTVYVVAGSSGWATFATGRHPAMYTQIVRPGSLVLDVNGPRLDAQFLRDTGVVEDSFTIIKGLNQQPFHIVSLLQVQNNSILTWKSQPGHRYHVEWTESLSAPDWTFIREAVVATGATTTWTNQFLPLDIRAGYYRVVEFND